MCEELTLRIRTLDNPLRCFIQINDDIHSWSKTCNGLASSLPERLIHHFLALALTVVLFGIPARPQSVPSCPVSANDLARRVVTNELRFQDGHTNWMYRLEKEQNGKKRVEEIVETKEGSVSRLLSINDLPLTAQQKLRRGLEAETLQGRRLFKILPDAFVFIYAGGEGNLAKLSFSPNPSF